MTFTLLVTACLKNTKNQTKTKQTNYFGKLFEGTLSEFRAHDYSTRGAVCPTSESTTPKITPQKEIKNITLALLWQKKGNLTPSKASTPNLGGKGCFCSSH